MKARMMALAVPLAAIMLMISCHVLAASTSPPARAIDMWLAKAIERDSSTASVRAATNRARAMWDEEMNNCYKRLMSRLDASQQAALRTSQRSWLKFRDSEFEVISQIEASKDGTVWQMMATSDGMEVVKTRAIQLREYEALLDK